MQGFRTIRRYGGSEPIAPSAVTTFNAQQFTPRRNVVAAVVDVDAGNVPDPAKWAGARLKLGGELAIEYTCDDLQAIYSNHLNGFSIGAKTRFVIPFNHYEHFIRRPDLADLCALPPGRDYSLELIFGSAATPGVAKLGWMVSTVEPQWQLRARSIPNGTAGAVTGALFDYALRQDEELRFVGLVSSLNIHAFKHYVGDALLDDFSGPGTDDLWDAVREAYASGSSSIALYNMLPWDLPYRVHQGRGQVVFDSGAGHLAANPFSIVTRRPINAL